MRRYAHRWLMAPVLVWMISALSSTDVARAAPLNVSVAGDNGVTRINDGGRACAEGGDGSYRHHSLETALPAGVLSKRVAGDLRASLDLHFEEARLEDRLAAGSPLHTAFFPGQESHVTLSNQRGAVHLRLTGGDCAAPPLSFDGVSASGSKVAWAVSSATGAYRGASGAGTADFTADMGPGADNHWSLALNGSVNVLQPNLEAKAVRSYWGNLGLDYLARVVTVIFEIRNPGEGDAFGAALVGATSPTAGVTRFDPQVEQPLGDLPARDVEEVAVRYRLSTDPGSPCAAVLLGCSFDATLEVKLPDALDDFPVPHRRVTVPARAPDLPPDVNATP